MVCISFALIGTACGGTDSTTAPTSTSTIANLAGNWSGTIAMATPPATFKSGSPILFNMSLTENGSAVTGTWTSPGNYSGQVSGTLTSSSFSGTLNYNGGDAATACSGSAAAVSGTVASGGKSFSLTSTGFSGDSSCRSGTFTITESK